MDPDVKEVVWKNLPPFGEIPDEAKPKECEAAATAAGTPALGTLALGLERLKTNYH